MSGEKTNIEIIEVQDQSLEYGYGEAKNETFYKKLDDGTEISFSVCQPRDNKEDMTYSKELVDEKINSLTSKFEQSNMQLRQANEVLKLQRKQIEYLKEDLKLEKIITPFMITFFLAFALFTFVLGVFAGKHWL